MAEIMEVEEVDEYHLSFQKIEESGSNKIDDYLLLLKNNRDDEKAIKIKEECIYR